MESPETVTDWELRMRHRTLRQRLLAGSAPPGWHLLHGDGEFGFIDVQMPVNSTDKAELVRKLREHFRDMDVRACLFVLERALGDGHSALFFQLEAHGPHGQKLRQTYLHSVGGSGSDTDEVPLVQCEVKTALEANLLEHGLFPDLLPPPPRQS